MIWGGYGQFQAQKGPWTLTPNPCISFGITKTGGGQTGMAIVQRRRHAFHRGIGGLQKSIHAYSLAGLKQTKGREVSRTHRGGSYDSGVEKRQKSFALEFRVGWSAVTICPFAVRSSGARTCTGEWKHAKSYFSKERRMERISTSASLPGFAGYKDLPADLDGFSKSEPEIEG